MKADENNVGVCQSVTLTDALRKMTASNYYRVRELGAPPNEPRAFGLSWREALREKRGYMIAASYLVSHAPLR